MKAVEASLTWSLFVECPHCSEEFDLSDSPHDDEGYFSIPIFNNKWDEVKGKEADCPKCGVTFYVSDVVY